MRRVYSRPTCLSFSIEPTIISFSFPHFTTRWFRLKRRMIFGRTKIFVLSIFLYSYCTTFLFQFLSATAWKWNLTLGDWNSSAACSAFLLISLFSRLDRFLFSVSFLSLFDMIWFLPRVAGFFDAFLYLCLVKPFGKTESPHFGNKSGEWFRRKGYHWLSA